MLSDSAAPVSSLEQAPTGSGVNSPGLTPGSTKPKRRAISDGAHIFRIIGDLQMARRQQNEKNGRIQAKLNSERPYNDNQLDAEGLGYKSNVSTKPLATTVGKVSSRLTKAVESSRYLTASSLPDSFPDAKKKTELFRSEATNLIRNWPGWYNFVNESFHEDAVFGWATVAWLDEYAWKPKFFRQDRAYMPDGTKQTVDAVPFIAFQEYVYPYELASMIENREAAEKAGWNIVHTVDSINNARVPSIPSAQAAPYTDFRRYEDAIRESSVSLSLMAGAKQIMLWHALAVEIDGRVSHYIADGNSQKVLFEKEDRYDSIKDCLAVLTYEHAQTLMGSKGIGREVYELAGALDRSRNEMLDRLQMSGKVFVRGPENKIQRFKLHVIGNIAIIGNDFEIAQVKIDPAVNEFLALEQQLTAILDQIAGGVTPRTFERERVTKAEVDLFASREEERRDDITTRAVRQFAEVISTMQRRAYNPRVKDADAKASRERLLRYMSEEELEFLRTQPAIRTVEDYTMSEAQKIVLIAQEGAANPLYDHRKLEHKKLSVLMTPEFADDVLLPENDPTVTAEQARAQLLENALLEQGREMPVSPRDAHDVHLQVLKQGVAPVAQAAGGGDAGAIAALEQYVKHWEGHLEALLQSGADKTALAPEVQQLKEVAQHLGELQAQAQAQMQQAAAVVAPPAGEPPPAAPPVQ